MFTARSTDLGREWTMRSAKWPDVQICVVRLVADGGSRAWAERALSEWPHPDCTRIGEVMLVAVHEHISQRCRTAIFRAQLAIAVDHSDLARRHRSAHGRSDFMAV